MKEAFMASLDELTKKHNTARFFVWIWYVKFGSNERDRIIKMIHEIYESHNRMFSIHTPLHQTNIYAQISSQDPKNDQTYCSNLEDKPMSQVQRTADTTIFSLHAKKIYRW